MRTKTNTPNQTTHFLYSSENPRQSAKSAVHNRKRRGIGLLWLIISFMALLAFMTLGIEAGRVYVTSHQLQNAADAAALAGARMVSVDPASASETGPLQTAINYAEANDTLRHADDTFAPGVHLNPANTYSSPVLPAFDMSEPNFSHFSAADVYVGRYVNQSRLFYLNDLSPDALLVIARKDDNFNAKLPLMFGRIISDSTLLAGDRRYALAKSNDVWEPGLNVEKDLRITGGAMLDVQNGGTRVGGDVDMEKWVENDGTVVINTDRMYVGGTLDDKNNIPPPSTDAQEGLGPDTAPDPYRLGGPNPLDEPSYTGLPDLGTIASQTNVPTAPANIDFDGISHYYYAGGIEFTSGNVTLPPGIYHLGGTKTKGGLQIGGSASLNAASGVMFHIVSGPLNAKNIQVTAPSEGYYKGIAIFQSRNNTADAIIHGSADLNINGELYFPNNHLTLDGVAGSFGTRLIVEDLTINGGGSGSGNISLVINWPGKAKVGDRSYLVE